MDSLLITGAQIGSAEGCLHDAWLTCTDDKISAIGQGTPPAADQHIAANGAYLLPGFIDIHVHGAVGHDTMDAEREGLLAMATFFARQGVTAFLPTTLTASRADTDAALKLIRDLMGSEYDGARIIGAHLEGPYLNPAKSGAQNLDQIREIDRDEFASWLALDVLRLVSIAPEVQDSAWLIETCRERGVTVSAAHTAATYDETCAAIGKGLTHATHTYNAMPALNHRQPGALAALMLDNRVRCEIIADFIHVHPVMIRLLYQTIGQKRLMLVSDAMRATGQPDGVYQLGNYAVTVRDGEARLDNGALAGSTLTMQRAFSNFCQATGLNPCEAWPVASRNAAAAIGVADRKGQLAVGYDADLVLLDQEDWSHVFMTIVGGRIVYTQEAAL